MWPPYKNAAKLANAIRNCEKPVKHWTEHKCRVLYQCETYEMARQKERQAAITSDLASDNDNDEICILKRKRRRPQRFLSSDEESMNAVDGAVSDEMAEPPAEQQLTAQCIPRPRPPKIPGSQPRTSQTASVPRSLSPPRSLSQGPRNHEVRARESPTKSSLEHKTLKVLKGIKTQLAIQAGSLKRIETALSAHIPPAAPEPPDSQVLELLPLASSSSLDELEKQLYAPKSRSDLVSYLSTIGGASPQDCVRHIMRRCMVDSYAQGFCMTGRKGKQAFLGHKLLDVVTGAVRKHFPEETDTHLKTYVADWLRYAPSRVKKRNSSPQEQAPSV
ncbi:uncharacterized protein LOC135377897 [Ornithodoros turicata]|uniref:uncharacterized protein LOC135377897 n=1 Tax=Ornithodoros turicata TaxID=34597 RepID=UPI003138C532